MDVELNGTNAAMLVIFFAMMWLMKKPALKQNQPSQQSSSRKQNKVIHWTHEEMLQRSLEKLRNAGLWVQMDPDTIVSEETTVSKAERMLEQTRAAIVVEQAERRALYRDWLENCRRVDDMARSASSANDRVPDREVPRGKLVYLAS